MNALMEKNIDMDMLRFEIRQRQLLDELTMKRVQVAEQKKELDTANLRIYELTTSLETSKTAHEESERNLTLAFSNSNFFENELNAKRNSASRAKIQYEAGLSDRSNLQELLQNEKLQNYNLTSELKELKAQHQCHVAYQNELLVGDAKIRERINNLTDVVSRFEADYSKILELSSNIKSCADLEKAVHFYRSEFQNKKSQYEELEKKYITVSAAVNKFKMLLEENHEDFKPDKNTQLILTHWYKAQAMNSEHKKIQEDVIQNLSQSLAIEKAANIRIYVKEAELEDRIIQLQKENAELKLKLTNVPTGEVEVTNQVIKNEIVEILEDS